MVIAGRGVSGAFAQGSMLAGGAGEPKDSLAKEGLLFSICSAAGDVLETPCGTAQESREGTEFLRATGGGLGVPTIFAYGSQGDDGLDPFAAEENICVD